MHLGGHCYNRVKLLTSKGAEKTTVASVADCEVETDSRTAGHERKHNACRAESEVAVVVIPISEEYEAPQNMWGSLSEDSTQAQANTRPLRHKANRLVTGALRLSVAGVRRQEVVGSSVAGR